MSEVQPTPEATPKITAADIDAFVNGTPAKPAEAVAPVVEPEATDDDVFAGWPADEEPEAVKPEVAPTITPTVELEAQFVGIAKKLGVEAKSEEELVEAVNKLRAQPIIIGGDENTQAINRHLASDDRTLATEVLRNEGLSDADVSEWFEKKDAIDIKRLASGARTELNNILKNYSNSIEQNRKAEEAKLLSEIASRKNQLKESLSKTDNFFGLKIGKNPEEAAVIKDKLYNYITSGQFHKKVSASVESEARAAWLSENAEAFAKANYQRGLNDGRKALLGKMEVPEHAGMRPQTAQPQEDKKITAADIKAFLGE